MLDLSPQSGGRGSSPLPDVPADTVPANAVPANARATAETADLSFQLYKNLGLNNSTTPELRERTDRALAIINNLFTDDGEMLEDIDLKLPIWSDRARVERALHAQVRLADIVEKSGDRVNFENLPDLDLDRVRSRVVKHFEKGAFRRFFDTSLDQTYNVLSRVIVVSTDTGELIKQIDSLKELQDLLAESTKNRRIWSSLLGAAPTPEQKRDPRFWFKAAQFALALVEFTELISDHPDQKRLRQLLNNPKDVYKYMQ